MLQVKSGGILWVKSGFGCSLNEIEEQSLNRWGSDLTGSWWFLTLITFINKIKINGPHSWNESRTNLCVNCSQKEIYRYFGIHQCFSSSDFFIATNKIYTCSWQLVGWCKSENAQNIACRFLKPHFYFILCWVVSTICRYTFETRNQKQSLHTASPYMCILLAF